MVILLAVDFAVEFVFEFGEVIPPAAGYGGMG